MGCNNISLFCRTKDCNTEITVKIDESQECLLGKARILCGPCKASVPRQTNNVLPRTNIFNTLTVFWPIPKISGCERLHDLVEVAHGSGPVKQDIQAPEGTKTNAVADFTSTQTSFVPYKARVPTSPDDRALIFRGQRRAIEHLLLH